LQVSKLFANHPDLLKEFTYFLPEGVQGQAKERLTAAAMNYKNGGRRGGSKGKRGQPGPGDRQGGAGRSRPPEGKSRKRAHEASSRSREDEVSVHASDRRFFRQIKSQLASRTLWEEFLKALSLYSSGVVTGREVVTLLGHLLGRSHVEILSQLCEMMNVPMPDMPDSSSSSDESEDEPWMWLPMSEMDLTQSSMCTPSYRTIPPDYPPPVCTGRTQDEREMLNDKWVSVPTGSEEDCYFKNMRKNIYEEALFKCEDEQYELDVVISTNTATIRRLQAVLDLLEAHKQQHGEQKKGDLVSKAQRHIVVT
jgi:paired amphipathic helix protein Sin3a